MTNLTDTRIFAVEARDEHRRLTARVHLVMDGAHFKDSRSTGSNLHIDEARAVLDQHAGAEGAVDGEVDLGCARMGMREIKTAGTKISDCLKHR